MEDDIAIAKPQTKQCPFCAETIQAAAIKCRFCNEFLNTDRAKNITTGRESNQQDEDDPEDADDILFYGKPSLWGAAATFIKGLIFLTAAIFLIIYPIENLSIFQHPEQITISTPDSTTDPIAWNNTYEDAENSENTPPKKPKKMLGLTEQQKITLTKYRIIAGKALAILVVLIIALKIIKLKTVYYEVTPDRIEWSRGILDRRVDNLDMFRVVDLRLRRSLLDCLLGIGTVILITKDKTDPEFTFEKIRKSRKLYDIIKNASLEADKKNNVMHLE